MDKSLEAFMPNIPIGVPFEMMENPFPSMFMAAQVKYMEMLFPHYKPWDGFTPDVIATPTDIKQKLSHHSNRGQI